MSISTSLLRPLVATALAVLTLGATAPAQADPNEPEAPEATHWYLALGDSVSAGLQPGTGVDRSGAFTGSVLAHLQQSDPKTRLRNLACEVTETSPEMIDGGNCTYEEGSQLAQALVFLRAHSETTDLVTITIGGNDITPCLARPTVGEIQACVAVRLNALAANLSHILREVRAAAPNARVVVGNYYNPYIVHPAFGPLSAGLAGALNSVIAQVAAAYASPVANVAGEFNSYDGDGTPSLALAQATICDSTWMCTLGNIHPNDAGYRLYAVAFIDALA